MAKTLFLGVEGSGKTTLAMALTRAFLSGFPRRDGVFCVTTWSRSMPPLPGRM